MAPPTSWEIRITYNTVTGKSTYGYRKKASDSFTNLMVMDTVFGKTVKTESADGLTGMVSYAAPYAVMVHEDLTRHHTNGSAKFLDGCEAALNKIEAEDPL